MEQHAPISALPNSSSELVLSEGMQVTCGHMIRDRHLLLFRESLLISKLDSQATASSSQAMALTPGQGHPGSSLTLVQDEPMSAPMADIWQR